MKTTAVRIEGGAFSLVSHPHHVAFGSSSVPAPRNLPSKENNGFDGCIMQKFRYFFFAKWANFSAFSPILLHQNNQAITRPYKNNIWIRIRARRHFCSCLIICSTVTCILTCGMWPVKSPALSLLPKASQLNSIFLAIACTIDVILPANIANVFQIWSTQAGYIRSEF